MQVNALGGLRRLYALKSHESALGEIGRRNLWIRELNTLVQGLQLHSFSSGCLLHSLSLPLPSSGEISDVMFVAKTSL